MDRSLYSLILMDDVVAAVDRMAVRMNTSRSNLVNQILAEYVSMQTPEKRIDGVFKAIEKLLASDDELIPFVAQGGTTMSVKSSLAYRYRPTIKYDVQLYRVPNGAIGELTVAFRTQSQPLLDAIAEFFRLFKRLEDNYVAPLYPAGAITYELYDGRFVRSIPVVKDRDYSSERLGESISAYVRMFDALMKGYINGRLSPAELEKEYVSYLDKGIGVI